jgi:hypothetical protein
MSDTVNISHKSITTSDLLDDMHLKIGIRGHGLDASFLVDSRPDDISSCGIPVKLGDSYHAQHEPHPGRHWEHHHILWYVDNATDALHEVTYQPPGEFEQET